MRIDCYYPKSTYIKESIWKRLNVVLYHMFLRHTPFQLALADSIFKMWSYLAHIRFYKEQFKKDMFILNGKCFRTQSFVGALRYNETLIHRNYMKWQYYKYYSSLVHWSILLATLFGKISKKNREKLIYAKILTLLQHVPVD